MYEVMDVFINPVEFFTMCRHNKSSQCTLYISYSFVHFTQVKF